MSTLTRSIGELRIEADRRGTALVVLLSGRAHMNTSAQLGEELVAMIDEATRTVVVDLSGLEFISSLGLGGIIAAHLRCARKGGVVRLVKPTPAIMEVLTITKLTQLFPIHDSVDDALSSS